MKPVAQISVSGSGVRGFTLVEVVVALAILSLVMLGLISGMRTLGNTQSAIDRMTGRVDEIRTVSSFLRDALESAVIGSDSQGLTLGGMGGVTSFFRVEDQTIAWKSTVLFGEDFGGSYFLRVAQEGDLLVLRWQEPNELDMPGDWADALSRTLVADLQELAISYRLVAGGNWLDDWVLGNKAVAVRLQLKVADRYWPDLIMQVAR
jgi:general secretion pathway protein J